MEQVVSTAEVSIDCALVYPVGPTLAQCLFEAWTETVTTIVTQKEVQWKIMCGGDCGGNCNSNTGTCS